MHSPSVPTWEQTLEGAILICVFGAHSQIRGIVCRDTSDGGRLPLATIIRGNTGNLESSLVSIFHGKGSYFR